MRIERLQEALEGLGLDTEGKRFNLLQRLAEALVLAFERLVVFLERFPVYPTNKKKEMRGIDAILTSFRSRNNLFLVEV